MIVVTAGQMQAIDRHTIESIGICGVVLMENAARGATRCFLTRLYRPGIGRVGVLAGRGNNGGDGFVMARYLAQRGVDVEVFLAGRAGQINGDAATNLNLLHTLKVRVTEIPDNAAFDSQTGHMRHIVCWIDALLGTGLNADVQGYYRRLIEFLNASQRPVLAVDIPSGLNADTGQPCGVCVQAAVTVTFGFPKIGQLLYPGAGYCGTLEVIDIGIPTAAIQAIAPQQRLSTGALIREKLPRRPADAHKGTTGHALFVAGSSGKTGAAAMTALSALRAGAGLVTLATAQSLNPVLETLVLEAMTLPLPDGGSGALTEQACDALIEAAAGKQCLAIGPGLGVADTTRTLVRRLVQSVELPMVIDADGLNLLTGALDLLRERKADTILTPHPGEMARLCGLTTTQIQNDRIGAARRLAAQCGVHVILKGARTVIAEPGGLVWLNPTGNSGMASGGMGDVLTGVVAGLLAQGCSARDAAVAAVYLHGLAADLVAQDYSRGYLATQVMEALGRATQRILSDPPPPPIATPVL